MLDHLIIHLCSNICQVVASRRLTERKRQFQTFSSKSGCGHLQEVKSGQTILSACQFAQCPTLNEPPLHQAYHNIVVNNILYI